MQCNIVTGCIAVLNQKKWQVKTLWYVVKMCTSCHKSFVCKAPRMNEEMRPWVRIHTVFSNDDKSTVKFCTVVILESTGLKTWNVRIQKAYEYTGRGLDWFMQIEIWECLCLSVGGHAHVNNKHVHSPVVKSVVHEGPKHFPFYSHTASTAARSPHSVFLCEMRWDALVLLLCFLFQNRFERFLYFSALCHLTNQSPSPSFFTQQNILTLASTPIVFHVISRMY